MKVLKKRIVAIVVLVAMMTTSMAVYAFDSELVDGFVDGIYGVEADATDTGLSYDSREEFVELLELFAEVNDPDGLSNAYADAFAVLAPSQQDRLESFGATVSAAGICADYIANDAEYSFENLSTYLGLADDAHTGEDRVAFTNAILDEEASFETSLSSAGISISNLEDGFNRMDKAFDLLHDTRLLNSYGLSLPFLVTTAEYEDFTIDRDTAGTIIEIANDQLDDDIETTGAAIDALEEIAQYYNELPAYDANDDTTHDRMYIYDYLNNYGFITIENGSNDNTNNDNNNTGTTTTVVADTAAPLGLSDLGDPDFVASTIATIQSGASETDIMALIEEIMGYINDPFSALTSSDILNAFNIVLEAYQVIETEENSELLSGYLGDILARLALTTNKFEDMNNYSWATGFVEFLAAMDIVNGTSETTFSPSVDIKRADFVAIVVRMFDLEDTGEAFTFTDVPESKWYYDEVKIAYNNGIIKGKSSTRFAPREPITREEMAIVISNCLALLDITEPSLTQLPFNDVDDISSWAENEVLLAYDQGIITGYPDNTFRPDDNASRVEAATMLYRLYLLK